MAANWANVADEYEKNDDLKREDVTSLMRWTEEDANVPKLNELQTILFLQSCYMDQEAARNAIRRFFEIKRSNLDIFGNRDPTCDAIKTACDLYLIAPLPKRSQQGDLVLYLTFLDADPAKFNFVSYVRLFDMVLMSTLGRVGTTNGLVVVVDQTNVTFRHILKMGLRVMKVYLAYAQEALPIRIKSMHYINVVPFVDKVLALMRPFVKKELMDMVCVHSKIEQMYELVPKECLPEELGGLAGSVYELHERQKQNLMDSAEFFNGEEKLLAVGSTARVQVGSSESAQNDRSNMPNLLQRSLRFIRFR